MIRLVFSRVHADAPDKKLGASLCCHRRGALRHGRRDCCSRSAARQDPRPQAGDDAGAADREDSAGMSTPRKKRATKKTVPVTAPKRAPVLTQPSILIEVRELILTA